MTDLVFDTETTGLDMWYPGGGLDGAPARPFMFQWGTPTNPAGQASEYVEDWIHTADNWSDVRWVAHNLPFDVHQLHEGPGIDLLDGRPLCDTDHLARIVWPGRRFADEHDLTRSTHGYKLKDLAADYFDPDAKDGQAELERLAESHGFKLKGKNAPPAAFYKLWLLEPEAMEFYAREDVRLTRGLLEVGEKLLTEKTKVIWELEQTLAPIVIRSERIGITVDQERLAPLRARFTDEAASARAELDATLDDGWDQNNDTLAESLQKHGVPLTERTASGQIAVNQKVLNAFVDDHPILQQLAEWKLKDRFVTTYLDHMDHPVVHPTFWQIGTKTGRMSGSNPNMQNVPTHVGNEVRELYVPREGMAFVAIDYEQIELRLLGYYLHNPGIQDRIENSDFFAWVAAQTAGSRPEYRAHVGDVDYFRKGQPGAPWRTTNKNATYAIVYGVGGLKLGKMLGWPPDSVYTPNDFVVRKGYMKAGDPRCKRAEALRDQIKSVLTGYGKVGYRGPGSGSGLLGRISDQVVETGAVNTIMGRHQWVGHDGAWQGLSQLIQGGAADIFKQGVIYANEAVKPLGAYPLLYIHDEIVFEAPVEHAEEVLEVASAAMREAHKLKPALEVEGAIGYKNWGECK